MSQQLSLFPTIYIDLDDVLAETLRAFSKVAQRLYGRSIPFERIHSFDLGKSFELTSDELIVFMHAAHRPEVLIEDVEPVPYAQEVLAAWSRANAHITIVTGRPISTYDATCEWLGRYEMPFHSLRFLRKYGKNDLTLSARKPLGLRTLRNASFTFCVEDSPKMANYIVKELKLPVVFLTKPWNQPDIEVEDNPLLRRCISWTEASKVGFEYLNTRREAVHTRR